MRFEWFVCLRYLRAKRKQNFISLISIISVAGVAIGVMALIIVLSVMTGFTDELRDKILGINSHIVVQKVDGRMTDYAAVQKKLEAMPGIVATTPYIFAQTMITSGQGGTGAILRGLDAASANRVLDLDRHIKGGRIADLERLQGEAKLPGIILGAELAKQLRVFQGSRVRLLSTGGALSPIGVLPRVKTCEVIGIFKTDMYEYDSGLAYVALPVAQDFMELGADVHGVEVRLGDIFAAHGMARRIERDMASEGVVARDWISQNKSLFSALELEKKSMFIIITLVVIVAAFNIVSTLIMVVMEKNKDIAILKSMGATASQIMKIFIYEGLVIGLSGTVAGIAGGLLVCDILRRYKFIKLPDVYPISTLPVEVVPRDVLLISASAVLITLVATLYPSWQAAKIDPATALRYE